VPPMRTVLTMLCLLALSTAAYAVPTCVPGTVADYIALSNGCRIGVMTVSDFTYSGDREIFGTGFIDIPAEFVAVTPSSPYGPSGFRLTFGNSPVTLFTDYTYSFKVHADGPWIKQYALFLLLANNASFVSAGGQSSGVGFVLGVDEGQFVDVRDGTQLSERKSFNPLANDTILVNGAGRSSPFGGIGSFAFDAVTPEPTTLLLWGAGATALGLARWRRLRKHGDHAGKLRRLLDG